MDLSQLINEPIKNLQVSESFKAKSKELGFKTLKEILLLSPNELLNWPGFSYIWFGDLISLLSEHKILHILQPGPGQKKIDVSDL